MCVCSVVCVCVCVCERVRELVSMHECSCLSVACTCLCTCECVCVSDLYDYMPYINIITSLTEVDECVLGAHNCEQLCFNTNGSFVCACRGGYYLKRDVSCEGRLEMHSLTT